METADSYQISGDWTDLNALSGIDIGQQITLHNAGRAGDIIEVAVSAIEPSVSLRGVAIKALEPQYRIGPQEVAIWARYIRYDLNGTITPQPQHKCLLNVQSISDIEEVGSIPSSLLTTNDKDMLLKISVGNLSDIAFLMASQLSSLLEVQQETLSQLKLLNARIEEAFETNITEDDANVYSGN